MLDVRIELEQCLLDAPIAETRGKPSAPLDNDSTVRHHRLFRGIHRQGLYFESLVSGQTAYANRSNIFEQLRILNTWLHLGSAAYAQSLTEVQAPA